MLCFFNLSGTRLEIFLPLKLSRGAIIATTIGLPNAMVSQELIVNQAASSRQGIESLVIASPVAMMQPQDRNIRKLKMIYHKKLDFMSHESSVQLPKTDLFCPPPPSSLVSTNIL